MSFERVRFTWRPMRGTLALARGLNDHAGLLGTARLGLTKFLGQRLVATTSIGGTLADARQMRREFGVSRTEAVRRQALITAGDLRLRRDEGSSYRPDGGLSQIGGSIALAYLLSPRWSALSFGGLSWLGDEPAGSPLVRQREQLIGGLGIVWRR